MHGDRGCQGWVRRSRGDAARGARGVSSAAPVTRPWAWEQPLPPQRRGRERSARIVAAAADLIDTYGPAGAQVSIRGIADGAHTAPASIYHYFPNVEAVIAAVATEYMKGLLAATAHVFDAEHPTYEVLQRRLVHAFWRYFAARAGLRELWFQRRASAAVISMHEHYRQLLAGQLQAAAARYVDQPGELLNYTMVLEMSGALWQLAFKLDPAGDPQVVEEIHANAWALLQRRAFGAVTGADSVPRR